MQSQPKGDSPTMWGGGRGMGTSTHVGGGAWVHPHMWGEGHGCIHTTCFPHARVTWGTAIPLYTNRAGHGDGTLEECRDKVFVGCRYGPLQMTRNWPSTARNPPTCPQRPSMPVAARILRPFAFVSVLASHVRALEAPQAGRLVASATPVVCSITGIVAHKPQGMVEV